MSKLTKHLIAELWEDIKPRLITGMRWVALASWLPLGSVLIFKFGVKPELPLVGKIAITLVAGLISFLIGKLILHMTGGLRSIVTDWWSHVKWQAEKRLERENEAIAEKEQAIKEAEAKLRKADKDRLEAIAENEQAEFELKQEQARRELEWRYPTTVTIEPPPRKKRKPKAKKKKVVKKKAKAPKKIVAKIPKRPVNRLQAID